MFDTVCGCYQAATRHQHPFDLGQSQVEVRYVVEHPCRHDTVELPVSERQGLHVTNLGLDSSPASQLNHPRRNVDRPVAADPAFHESLGEVSSPGAYLQNAPRSASLDGPREHLLDVLAFQIGVERAPGREPTLAAVLASYVRRIVEAGHGLNLTEDRDCRATGGATQREKKADRLAFYG